MSLAGKGKRQSYQVTWILYLHFPERGRKKAEVFYEFMSWEFPQHRDFFPENIPAEKPAFIKFFCLSSLPPGF